MDHATGSNVVDVDDNASSTDTRFKCGAAGRGAKLTDKWTTWYTLVALSRSTNARRPASSATYSSVTGTAYGPPRAIRPASAGTAPVATSPPAARPAASGSSVNSCSRSTGRGNSIIRVQGSKLESTGRMAANTTSGQVPLPQRR